MTKLRLCLGWAVLTRNPAQEGFKGSCTRLQDGVGVGGLTQDGTPRCFQCQRKDGLLSLFIISTLYLVQWGFVFLSGVWFEPRAFCLLGRCSATDLHSLLCFSFLFFFKLKAWSWEVAQASLKFSEQPGKALRLQSFCSGSQAAGLEAVPSTLMTFFFFNDFQFLCKKK